jgi:hypothetical protein
MRCSIVIGIAALLTSVTGAAAQTVPAPVSTDPGTTPRVPAKPARAKKPAAQQPASVVTVVNASTHTATMVVITTEDATASTSKPLASKARTTLKLPKTQGCTVSVSASFQGGGQVDVGEFDICKDKTIRFTD